MSRIRGNGNVATIHDTKGTTHNQITGSHNRIKYVGDDGANTFRVGGRGNNVDVFELGTDDQVVLEGRKEDWKEIPGSRKDKRVGYINKITGNKVTIHTDNFTFNPDKFLKDRIKFTGGVPKTALPQLKQAFLHPALLAMAPYQSPTALLAHAYHFHQRQAIQLKSLLAPLMFRRM